MVLTVGGKITVGSKSKEAIVGKIRVGETKTAYSESTLVPTYAKIDASTTPSMVKVNADVTPSYSKV